MKIRTRLTLLFTVITATILLVFAAVIYFSAKQDREREFYSVLKSEAVTKANLFFEAQVPVETLQNIYRNNRQTINEVEVAIYDPQFHLLYHDAVDIDVVKETETLIDQIYSRKEVHFYQDQWQVVGMVYTFKGKQYIITAAALDQYGYNKLENLLQNSLVIFIISLAFIYLLSHFFTNKALNPVREMTDKARLISATNLDLRLSSGTDGDELAELANTFNEMLMRLEKSFDAQKHFVSNISHELRTPLSAIIAELELALAKENTNEGYQKAIAYALTDTQKLVRLSNSLLDLAKASYDPSEIAFKAVRIDEVLLDAMQQVQQANRTYKVDIHFENDFEEDEQICVNGNTYLLKVAFANLIENGCKFSTNLHSRVTISFKPRTIALTFVDHGIGIPSDEVAHIFTPFYRGQNSEFSYGHGIGLSLTQKIIVLHKGSIRVDSTLGKGTQFLIELPHL